jgi:hypothetical protein
LEAISRLLPQTINLRIERFSQYLDEINDCSISFLRSIDVRLFSEATISKNLMSHHETVWTKEVSMRRLHSCSGGLRESCTKPLHKEYFKEINETKENCFLFTSANRHQMLPGRKSWRRSFNRKFRMVESWWQTTESMYWKYGWVGNGGNYQASVDLVLTTMKENKEHERRIRAKRRSSSWDCEIVRSRDRSIVERGDREWQNGRMGEGRLRNLQGRSLNHEITAIKRIEKNDLPSR